MTFEEYKQGLTKAVKQANDYEFGASWYNRQVDSRCNFKVRLGDLVDNINKLNDVTNSKVEIITQLNPYVVNSTKLKDFRGIVTIQIKYDVAGTSLPVVEQLAKFGLFPNTRLNNGSILQHNVKLNNNQGLVRLNLSPEISVDDLIVDIDLTNDYMLYPLFVKALFKCDIIEPKQNLVK